MIVMGKKYIFTPEELASIEEAQKQQTNKTVLRRLQVLQLRAQGYGNKEIGKITGYETTRVSQLVAEYKKIGLEAYARDNRKGGNHRNMSKKEEEQFLADFSNQSEKGQILTVKDIHESLEEKMDKHVSKSTTYRLLKRHEWRKIMPRPKHPKAADAETIKASKKLTPNSKI